MIGPVNNALKNYNGFSYTEIEIKCSIMVATRARDSLRDKPNDAKNK